MSKASDAARAKAQRWCGDAPPAMRKRREDGGAAGEGSADAGNSSTAGDSGSSGATPVDIAPQAPAPVSGSSTVNKEPITKQGPGSVAITTDGSPKPLNSQALRDGGRTTARRRYAS